MTDNKNNKETLPADTPSTPPSGKTDTRRRTDGASRETPKNTPALPGPSDIELVIRYSRALESLLGKRLGATGTGLHEKITSVEKRLGEPLVKRLRWIATIRNKVVHEEGFALPNAAAYEAVCKKCMDEVRAVKVAPKESPAARAARDRAFVKNWFQTVGVALAVSLLSLAAFLSTPNSSGWDGAFGVVSVLAAWFVVYCGVPVPVPVPAVGLVFRYLRTGDASALASALRRNEGASYTGTGGAPGRGGVRSDVGGDEARTISPQGDTSAPGPLGLAPDMSLPFNPASSLPMVPDSGMDVAGNAFGTDFHDSDFGIGSSSFDDESAFDNGFSGSDF